MSGPNKDMRCEDALRLLALYLDGELAHDDHGNIEHHLAHCRSCFSRAQFERQLKSQLAALGADPVPSDLEHRIRHLLTRFAE